MNIKVIVLVVLGIGLSTGLVFWQLGRSSYPLATGPLPTQTLEQFEDASNNPTPLSGRGTLATLRDLNQDLECRVTRDDEPGVTHDGTVFVSAGRIRGDFVTVGEGMSAVSSLIIRDGTLYLWSEIDGQLWGVKSTLATGTPPTSPQLSTQEPVALDDAIRYECKTWSVVDGSVFVPPADVLFRDVAEAAAQGMEYGTVFEDGTADAMVSPSAPTSGCAACAQVGDPAARELCEIEFSCGLQSN
jgi:hypothetical protein